VLSDMTLQRSIAAELLAPALAEVFDSTVIVEAGLKKRVQLSGDSVVTMVTTLNSTHASKYGEDFFKTTNKTAQALARPARPIATLEEYKRFVDDLYFLFWEGSGSRLETKPASFSDLNDLRTYLRHDVAHGKVGKVRAKNKKLGAAFAKYAGSGTPETFAPEKFVAVQAALLGAIEQDLRSLVPRTQPNKALQQPGGSAARS
jgi:hypothetical protein